MTKQLLNYLTYILFLVPFTLLIVDPGALFPFITTKAIIFRILITLGLFFVLWLYLINPQTFPKNNYLFLSVVLFLGINILATVFSIDPYRSFWGNAERMEGTWSLFFYLAYFFVLLTLFQFNPKAKKIIFYSILIVTTLISLLEINQALILKRERPSVTLGNPTYIGFLNLLTIFLILYFLFEKKFQLMNLESLIYIFLIFINLLSLISSETRGSILGLLAGLVSGIFYFFLVSKISFKKKILIFSLLLIFLVGFYLFLNTEIAFKIRGFKRLAETLQNPASFFPRLYAWKIFLDGFKQRPILGWGPETMAIVFYYNFDPKIFEYEQAIFDRPHNKFIEILTSTGILGFTFWILIFLAFFYYLFRSNLNLYQKTALVSFVFAYLAQNLTLFDIQASYILFFFGLALVSPKVDYRERTETFIRPYLFLISLLSLIIIIIHLKHFYIVRKIITYIKEPDPKVAGEGFLRLSEIAGPFLTEEAIIATDYFASKIDKVTHFNTILSFHKLASEAYKKDILDIRNFARYQYVSLILIESKRQLNLDYSNDIAQVENYYEETIRRYPTYYEIYYNYANFLKSVGKIDKAKNVLMKAEALFKDYSLYYFNEALFYLSINEKSISYQKLNLAFDKDLKLYRNEHFEAALVIYLSNGDVEKAKKVASLWLKLNDSAEVRKRINNIFKEYNQPEI